MKKNQVPPLQNTEWGFLYVTLICKCLLLITFLGKEIGYDVGGFLQHVSKLPWVWPIIPLRDFYYAHHPPVAFLMTKTVALFDVPLLQSAQIVAWCASLVTFLALRALLKQLDLLWEPMGFIFLYLTAALPLQVYLSVIVSIDVVILMFSSVILLLSVRLFWIQKKWSWSTALLLTASLILAMLTKYSGIILLSIPCLVALQSAKRGEKTFDAATIVAVAVMIVFPYYSLRYFVPEGTFFFDSAVYAQPALEGARAHFKSLSKFFYHLFFPTDSGHAWLSWTWNALWTLADRPAQSQAAAFIGRAYQFLSPLLIAAGLIQLIKRKTSSNWRRLGIVLIALAALEVGGLICYIHTFPFEGYFNNKGVYVAPASFAVTFLIASLALRLRKGKRLSSVLTVALLLFVIANYFLPVF